MAILRRWDHNNDMKIDFDEFLDNIGRSRDEIEIERREKEERQKE